MKIVIEGYSDYLNEVASLFIGDNVKFTYENNKITTEKVDEEYKRSFITVVVEAYPNLKVK